MIGYYEFCKSISWLVIVELPFHWTVDFHADLFNVSTCVGSKFLIIGAFALFLFYFSVTQVLQNGYNWNIFCFGKWLLRTLKYAQSDKLSTPETYRHLFQRKLPCAKRYRSRNSLHHKNQSLGDTLRSQSVVKNTPVSTTDRILNLFKYETS